MTDKEASKGERYIGFGRGFHWAMYASVTDEAVYSNDDQTYLVQRGQLSPVTMDGQAPCGEGVIGVYGKQILHFKILEQHPFRMNAEPPTAELRFIRAFRYFDLLKGFGGVPLVGDRVTELTDDFSGSVRTQIHR